MLAFLNANKTKLTGAILSMLAFIQTNTALNGLLTPTQYAWTMFFVGLFVTFLGFLNNPSPPDAPVSKNGGFVRPLMLAFLLAIAVPVTFLLPGCGTNSPIQQAESLEQKALATYGSYVIVKEQAAKLYADPVTPDSVKAALKAANDVAREPLELLYKSVITYKELQEAVAVGTATEAEMQEAAEALLRLYLEAGPALKSFEDEVHKVRK